MSERFASARLDMRPQTPDDAEALFEAYGDIELMTYWSSAPHADVEQTRAYLATRFSPTGGYDPNADWRGWSVYLKGDNRAIGTLAAGLKRNGVVEIGYMVVRRLWGQGYAREGVTRLLDLLFVEERRRRVMADTDPDNAPSNALLKSLGFTLEGHLRGEWDTHIGIRDSLIWGLLRDEWLARR
ncbi:GNAT family N-acetyltransferase [Sphingomonas sp. GlSt437]|uniref:GNAT family N-acetyltransferase n=1 Tax=Sphingomonas sp. GlSt437 TaxID=3389970 RepID=UPI003A87AD94